MGKEYILDILKENKTYNDTVLSLWSGTANYQDLLATAMLVMMYDLRQDGDCFLGFNEKEADGVVQLHSNGQSLVLWYTSGYAIPILATKENDCIKFTLYSYENLELIDYLEKHSSTELLKADQVVFDKLLSLVKSERSHLATKALVEDYTIDSEFLLTALWDVMDDGANMTTNVGLSLKDIYDLLNSKNNSGVYLPVEDNTPDGVPKLSPYLSKMTSFFAPSAYKNYKEFISRIVKANNGSYSDGTRIILSKDFQQVEVYDDKGLTYSVPLLKNTEDFGLYDVVLTQGELLKQLEYLIRIAETANNLYDKLGDLNEVEFTDAELLPGRVKLNFKKTEWNNNVKKEILGAIYFGLDGSLKVGSELPLYVDPNILKYITTFQTELKGMSAKLRLGEGESLTLPIQPMRLDKTVYSYNDDMLVDEFKEGIYFMENVTLRDLLSGYSMLADKEGDI